MNQETIDLVLKFRDDRNWRQFHTPKDLALSLTLEAAELLEVFQWSGTDLQYLLRHLHRIKQNHRHVPLQHVQSC